MSKFFTSEIGSYKGLEFITIKSKFLKRRGDICIYRPKESLGLKNVKTVILLHGVYGSHWAWTMKGGVHKSLDSMLQNQEIGPMILVMPSDGLYADGSGYLEHRDADYERWITTDVVDACLEYVPECSERSDFHICGLSMGGYGALRIGAKYPEKFKSFSGLSSITEFPQMQEFVEDFEQLKKSTVDKGSVLDAIVKNQDAGLIFRFDCGKGDPLVEDNRRLHENLNELHIEHIYEEFNGGHEWSYWKEHIRKTLRFFDLT